MTPEKNLQYFLSEIASKYPIASNENFSDHPMGKIVRTEFTKYIQDLIDIDKYFTIQGSVGKGRWADTPWIAIMDPLITTTTQSGYNILYSFSKSGGSIFLSIGQGVTLAKKEYKKDWLDVLKNKAEIYRTKLRPYKHSFTEGAYNLKGKTPLSKNYGETTIIYKEYNLNSIPSHEELLEDLLEIKDLYNHLTISEDSEDIISNGTPNKKTPNIEEKKIFRLHKRYEGRVDSKKIKNELGYDCQACGINFTQIYGELGKGYIEAHHLVPYKDLEKNRTRTLNIKRDFAVLCANCHRMIHRLDDPSNLALLKKNIKKIDKK